MHLVSTLAWYFAITGPLKGNLKNGKHSYLENRFKSIEKLLIEAIDGAKYKSLDLQSRCKAIISSIEMSAVNTSIPKGVRKQKKLFEDYSSKWKECIEKHEINFDCNKDALINVTGNDSSDWKNSMFLLWRGASKKCDQT